MLRERIRRYGVFFVVGLGLPPAACTGQQGDGKTDVVVVAVSVQPIAGLVDALAPEGLVEVIVLVPPGANPATHQPSIQALRRLSDAQLYLEIGHPDFMFERTWLDGALEGSSTARVLLFADCQLQREDPHAWLSTGCLASAANATASALAGVLPTHGDEITGNLERFLDRLQDTADSTARRLAPYQGRVFFVLHSAWGYLAHDSGLEQIAIQSHGTGDPGAARIAELIRLGIAEGVHTIFVQPQFNPVSANLIAEELGASVVTVDPLARNPLYIIESMTSALVAEFKLRSLR